MCEQSPYDELAEFYDLFSQEAPDDVPFYSKFVSSGSRVLEVGVGTGRVAFPLVRSAVPFSFEGVDYSPAMLEIAKEKARIIGVEDRVTLLQMDMRNLHLPEKYDLVLIPYLGFQFIMTPRDQLKTLRGIANYLHNEGLCIIHLFHPDPELIAVRGWKEELRQEAIDPTSRRKIYWWTRSKMDRINQKIVFEVIYRFDQPDNRCGELRSLQKMRYTFRWEMEHLAARAGFGIQAVFGNFQGQRLTTTSRDMIFVLRKDG